MKRALLLGLVLGCGPSPNPPPPRELPDGGVATCEGACTNLRARGCPEGEPTDEGETCEAICSNALSSAGARLDVACLQTAATCEAAGEC